MHIDWMKSAPVEWDFPPSKRVRRPLVERGDEPAALHLDVHVSRKPAAARSHRQHSLYDRGMDSYARFLFLILRFIAGAVLGLVILGSIWVASVIIRG